MKVFITGDRSMPKEVAVHVAGNVIGELAARGAESDGEVVEFITGDNKGLESGVLQIGVALGVEVFVIDTPYKEDGKPDWDARHEYALLLADLVVVVHSDILDSRIGSSCVRVVPDDKLLLIGG